tara:strand:- start:1022 stop:1168 length:147 start_codon:yes stop_codon:yes gene_type:complete
MVGKSVVDVFGDYPCVDDVELVQVKGLSFDYIVFLFERDVFLSVCDRA